MKPKNNGFKLDRARVDRLKSLPCRADENWGVFDQKTRAVSILFSRISSFPASCSTSKFPERLSSKSKENERHEEASTLAHRRGGNCSGSIGMSVDRP